MDIHPPAFLIFCTDKVKTNWPHFDLTAEHYQMPFAKKTDP